MEKTEVLYVGEEEIDLVDSSLRETTKDAQGISPQQGDLRLSGPPSGQGAGSGARTHDRRVPADLRADSQATVLLTPPDNRRMTSFYGDQMESNIVKDFENLKVFVQRNFIKMDELVQDLTSALEETAHMSRPGNSQAEGANSGSCSRRYVKKRRGIRRTSANNYYYKRGTISEASESSVDEQPVRDYAGNVIHSDSDDLAACHRIPKLTVPVVDPVPAVESDSFTENLSPLRPQRRRRKFKNMVVDSSPLNDHTPSDGDSVSGERQLGRKASGDAHGSFMEKDKSSLAGSKVPMQSPESSGLRGITAGKRKRSSKCRTDCNTYHQGSMPGSSQMEFTSISQESSLSSSEFDSDINTNIEDAREADDEQSDFFHEPGPACGIPDIVPWWENERVTDEPLRIDSDFEKILTGTFAHLPKLSNQSFKARMGRLMSGTGREIRLGRRKLKGKMPRYTVGRFLQDREHWNRIQSCHGGSMQPPGCSSASSSNYNNSNSSNGHGGEIKRRKHITRNSTFLEVPSAVVSSTSETLPDGSMGSKFMCSGGSSSSSNKEIQGPVVCTRKSVRKNGGAYSSIQNSDS
ncbi:G patch domain-containing protein 2-like [Plakobranchus ocellatus]|uniref:G patch domain-containing protein 2-like n=1 Tax=Plakobranchus ocellatus TaxID=259542 RepID=A0AAV4ATS7_9GAST|nr:G patch domain-containing protein 2-like [Plakobranchus ocellatus]